MVGLSRRNLHSRLFTTVVVLCLACCYYCILVECAIVPSKTQSPAAHQQGASPPITTRVAHITTHQQLSQESQPDSKSSSYIAIENNQLHTNFFKETKDSETSDNSQRIIDRNSRSAKKHQLLLDNSLTIREEADPSSRRRRSAQVGETDGIPVAGSGFLAKTVESFHNLEGSGSDPIVQTEILTSSVDDAQSSKAHTGEDSAHCPDCVRRKKEMEKLPPQKLRLLRLEKIKRQILSKLQLEQAPNVSAGSVDIPEPLARGHIAGDSDLGMGYEAEELAIGSDTWEEYELNEIQDNYEDISQVIITAQEGKLYLTHAYNTLYKFEKIT